MSKIDTQGMSMPIDPSDPNYKKTWNIEPHKPWLCTPTRVLTETMVKELKILINEVLDEREYKRRLAGPLIPCVSILSIINLRNHHRHHTFHHR